MGEPMNRDDDLVIELAAERRRREQEAQGEEDTKRAELPRAIRDEEAKAYWPKFLGWAIRLVMR